LKGLALKAPDRFQEMGEFQRAITGHAPSEPVGPIKKEPVPPVKKFKPSRRLLWVSGLMIALVVLGSVFGARYISKPPEPVPIKATEPAPVKKAEPVAAPEPAPAPVVKPEITHGRLKIDSIPSNAVVSVNGETKGTTPYEVGSMDKGRYTVEVKKECYKAEKKQIEIYPDVLHEETITLEQTCGSLSITSTPAGATVYVDDKKKGITPLSLEGLSKGSKTVRVEKPGYSSWKDEVVVEPGQTAQFSLELEKEPVPVVVELKTELKHGDRYRNSLGMEFVYIAPGRFKMGSPSTEPQRSDNETLHEVELTRGYYIQTAEVTQGQWQAVMGSNPSNFKDCGSDCPVENVSYEDIEKYIIQLNQKEKKEYSLPTEAQWEYAARAGKQTPFSFGACLGTDQANYDGNNPLTGCSKGEYREKTVKVKSFAPNAWGIYDMHGNVWEWCRDWYGEYPTGFVKDPEGPLKPTKDSDRVLRGGGWYDGARNCRSANRGRSTPGSRYTHVGFRLVLSPGHQ